MPAIATIGACKHAPYATDRRAIVANQRETTLQTNPKRLFTAFLRLVVAMAAAVAGGTVSIVVFSLAWETAGLGPIAALFVLPGVILYLLFDFWHPGSHIKDLGFAMPAVLIIVWFLWNAWWFSRHLDPDGAGEMAVCIAVTIAGAACAAYATLRFRRYE
jgi:hypothetical protein